jgi:TonB family protein
VAAADTVARADTTPGPGAGPAADTAGNAGPAGAPPEDSVTDAPSGPVYVTDVEELAAMGPAYTPYDRPPLLQKGRYLEGILRATVLPVVEKHDLPADEWARFWVLVDAEGRVRDAVLQLTSGHAAFDGAARAAALRLRFSPARRDGEIVPVWVLRRVSLLMG